MTFQKAFFIEMLIVFVECMSWKDKELEFLIIFVSNDGIIAETVV